MSFNSHSCLLVFLGSIVSRKLIVLKDILECIAVQRSIYCWLPRKRPSNWLPTTFFAIIWLRKMGKIKNRFTSNSLWITLFSAKHRTLPVTRQMAAGGLAGLCQIVITTPMELLKIQMQDAGRVAAQVRIGFHIHRNNYWTAWLCFQAKLVGKTVPKTSATKIALELFREKGIFGLYKGIGATTLRDVSFSIVYFPLFATLNSFGPRKNDGSGEAAFFVSFLSGKIWSLDPFILEILTHCLYL